MKSSKITLDSSLHAQVERHVEQRKVILESALGATTLLQHYEAFKGILQQKKEQRALFKQIIKDIHVLFSELQVNDLPETRVASLKVKEHTQKEQASQQHVVPRDKLAMDLMSIQEKLNSL